MCSRTILCIRISLRIRKVNLLRPPLKKLVNAIKKNYKNFVLGAFIDIAGAFDNTSHESIKVAMDRKGVDKKTSQWI